MRHLRQKTIRFILITVPPAPVAEKLEILRKEFNQIAGSRIALTYPPHITLRTGFLVPEKEIPGFVKELSCLFTEEKPFWIETDGIHCGYYEQDSGPQPIVCFRIKKSFRLASLNKKLLTYKRFRKSKRTSFDPHLTIAYEDLSVEGFERLKETIQRRPDIQKLQFRWRCDHAGLYIKKSECWMAYHTFFFR